jgi:hypothetical protein
MLDLELELAGKHVPGEGQGQTEPAHFESRAKWNPSMQHAGDPGGPQSTDKAIVHIDI